MEFKISFKECNFLSKKMLTNELWFVIINKLSQVSDNKPLQNEAKQNKKVVDSADDYDNISKLLKTTENIDN